MVLNYVLNSQVLSCFFQSAKFDGRTGKAKSTVNQALDKMATILSHKQANSTALAAVIEIRLETAVSEEEDEGIYNTEMLLEHADFILKDT